MPVSPRVSNHPVMSALATARDLLNRIPPDWHQSQPDLIARTQTVVDLMRQRLTDPAANALWDGALSNAHSWLQAIANELQASLNQGNPAVLANGQLQANLDSLAQNFGQYPTSQPTDALTAMVEEAQSRLNTMQTAQLQHEELWRSTKDQQARLLADAQEAKEAGLKRLREQETAAGKLLAALGAEGTSSGYRATADSEREQANFWRWLTLGAGVAAAILGIVFFAKVHDQEMASTVRRLAITLPVVLLTVYAGKQSAGHRMQEREARRLELAFGSVDAYLADLDDSKRAELKGVLTTNLYRAGSEDSPHADGYPSSAELVGLLSEAIKRLR